MIVTAELIRKYSITSYQNLTYTLYVYQASDMLLLETYAVSYDPQLGEDPVAETGCYTTATDVTLEAGTYVMLWKATNHNYDVSEVVMVVTGFTHKSGLLTNND